MKMKENLIKGSIDELDYRWLKIKLEGDRFYIMIIINNDKDGVKKLVKKIKGKEIYEIISNMESSG
jgi:hypothetical protein